MDGPSFRGIRLVTSAATRSWTDRRARACRARRHRRSIVAVDRRDPAIAIAFTGIVAAIVLGYLGRRDAPAVAVPATNPVAAVAATTPTAGSALPTSARDVALFADTLRDLRAGGDGVSDQARLQALAARLAGMGREDAVATIRGFLADGGDAPTRQGFVLGNDGLLAGAPTLRVFLLDLLERLDPVAAAEQAKAILANPTSADEWAVALRSLARGRPGERDLIAEKLHDLFRHDAWRAAPSTGWLEAFDVAVHLGGTAFVPDLTELMQPVNGPTANHAAFLALDRLAARDPAAVLTALIEAPEALAGRERSRAGMFARADVRETSQRAVLERYLLDPARSRTELDAFSGMYPNANFFVSANLLTTSPVPARDAILRHDAAALAVVDGWLAEPRFAAVRPHLERMQARLVEFTRQAR